MKAGPGGLWATPDCNRRSCATATGTPLVIGDADGLAIAALGGALAQAKAELAKGRVVIFGPRGNRGEQPLAIHAGSGDITVPGYVVERSFAYGDLPIGLMPASVAVGTGGRSSTPAPTSPTPRARPAPRRTARSRRRPRSAPRR